MFIELIVIWCVCVCVCVHAKAHSILVSCIFVCFTLVTSSLTIYLNRWTALLNNKLDSYG